MVKRKAIVGSVLVLVIAALVTVSASKRFLYFEELNEMTILLENKPFSSSYVGNFTDANNNTIARVQFFLRNFYPLPYYEAEVFIYHPKTSKSTQCQSSLSHQTS